MIDILELRVHIDFKIVDMEIGIDYRIEDSIEMRNLLIKAMQLQLRYYRKMKKIH